MPLFSRIVIVGVGLLGGSIGLAAKKNKLADCVVGIGRDEANLRTARDRGAIDLATTDFERGIRELGVPESLLTPSDSSLSVFTNLEFGEILPELIVIGTPVGSIGDMVWESAIAIDRDYYPREDGGDSSLPLRNVLITDVGSVKETICARFAGLDAEPLPNGCRFIGSHPIAGTERSGAENASADLFENRLAVITPTEPVQYEDIGLLKRFWHGLGSSVAEMSPLEHDRILARTSHLPHLVAVALAAGLLPEDEPYTGTGFRSTTRLAAGPPALWSDIIDFNSAMILDAIREFEGSLTALRKMLEQGDQSGITAILKTAKRNRDRLS